MVAAFSESQLNGHNVLHTNKLASPAPASTRSSWFERGTRRGNESTLLGTTMDDPVNLQFVGGDPEALRQIYRTHGKALYGVAYRVLGDRGLAEEALQQALLQAWRAADRFDPARNIAPWLVTITKRAAIDVYRRERRHRADELGDFDSPVSGADMESVWAVYRVRQAVELLAPQEREVLLLTHFEGLTHEAAAARLSVPLGTIKSRSYRAYRKLAGLLADMEEATP